VKRETVTIRIDEDFYKILKQWKEKGIDMSDVINFALQISWNKISEKIQEGIRFESIEGSLPSEKISTAEKAPTNS